MYKQPYLQKYSGKSSRSTCPQCKTKESFTLYLSGDTNAPIHSTVGKCNREVKCGYHYTPKQYFTDNPISKKEFTNSHKKMIPQPMQNSPINYIPWKLVKESASFNSNFVRFLCEMFTKEQITNAVENYALGATKNKEVIFWQMDINGKFRTGKVMQYNPDTGKRIKQQSGAINWVHNLLKKSNPEFKNFNLQQCYFGEHLLRMYSDKPIAVVEAEKTAIIASMVFPDFNWLAAGNLNGLSVEKSKIFKGKKVILYPDAGCYTKWKEKMVQLKSEIYCHISISDLVEKHASPQQIEIGYDIADFILEQLHKPNLPQGYNNNFSPTLNKMIEINPAVLSLINEFELEEV
ncbi:MAG: DUF6371 domain-containing protein [Petrimonas sp.]|nr:DUF6371 domain-containing protein [Petrimonas sp.]